MACFPLTRVPRYAMPNSSLHPAFAALPSAHPARGVDDELRWGPISLRVCTTCFAPSGPREVTGTLPSFSARIASYARALCPRRARWPASHTFGALGATAASHAHTTCSGPREPSVAAARRGRFERPRRALAPRLPPPLELRGACGRAAHAHRDGVRAAACRASPRSRARAPPNPQVTSGRRPDKRGGRDERLDGQGRVAGRM